MKNFIINLLDLKQEEVENIETVRNSTTNIVILYILMDNLADVLNVLN